MTISPTQQRAASQGAATRYVIRRSKGHRHGNITRLISPGDLGELLKPFVFLDLFEAEPFEGKGFAPHPHSGIATLTTFLEGNMSYGDTTGKAGSLMGGAVEWMRAGRGVWHAGEFEQGRNVRGYQLWLALPPTLELAPPESRYVEAEQIESVGPARVILGRYAGKGSPIPFTEPVAYLHVRLKDGEQWTYHPAQDHDVAFLALNAGRLHTGLSVLERELAIFAQGNGAIEVKAEGAAEFVIGSGARHRHPLVLGHYSVHTSPNALKQGKRVIADLKASDALAALLSH